MTDPLKERLQEALRASHTIERELGGGGMSHVYLADETALRRKVVIKLLPPDLTAGVSADRFRREIQLAAQLQHPGIVPLLSAGASDELLWYVMPYVEGESLRTRIGRGPIAIDEAVRLWRDLLEALEYAHGRGIVHRDIKPENIMLTGRRAVTLDFGVAKAVSASTQAERGATMTGVGLAIGTPAYMAPEQAAGESNVDPRADLYAAGLVMYEMLAGRGPFDATTAAQLMAAHIATPPTPIEVRRRDVSPSLAALVMQCIAKRPEDRPASAAIVLQQIDMALPKHTSAAESDAPQRTARTRRPLLFAIAVVAVGAIATAAWQFNRIGISSGEVATDASAIPDTARLQVALLPIARDSADAVLANSLSSALVAELNKEPRVLALREQQVDLFVEESGLADSSVTDEVRIKILRDYGVHTYLVRSMARSGAGLLLSIEARTTERDSVLFQFDAAAPSVTELPDVSRKLASQTRAALAQAFRRITRPAASGLALGTTSDAARLYVEGSALFDRQDYTHAAENFRQAIIADSTFARAWGKLGSTLFNAGESRQESTRARIMAYRYRAKIPSLTQRAAIEAQYHVRVTQDGDAAVRVLQKAMLQVSSPAQQGGLLSQLYLAYRWKGNEELALHAVERAAQLSSATPVAPVTGNLIAQLLRLGRVDEARRMVRNLESTVGRNSPAYTLAVQTMVTGLRDTDAMIEFGSQFNDSLISASEQIFRLRLLRSGLATSGRVDSAFVTQHRLLELVRASGNRYELLRSIVAEATWRVQLLDDRAGARRIIDDALRAIRPDTMAVLDRDYLPRIELELALGDVPRARALLAEWTSSVPRDLLPVVAGEIDAARGVIALASGNAAEAIRHFRSVDASVGYDQTSSFRLARAFDRGGQPDSAIAAHERYVRSINTQFRDINIVELAHSYRRLGELYEERGDVAKAIQRYGDFVELWKRADPALQPAVQSARERIAKLQRKAG